MRWSLMPAWWKKSPKEVPATFNARAEAVAAKPMFRTAFKERRCIVPASGFFEWTGEKGAKQPHLFTAADGSPLLALRRPLGPRERSPHRRRGSLLHNHRSGAPVRIEPSHDRMPVLPEMVRQQLAFAADQGGRDSGVAPADSAHGFSARLHRQQSDAARLLH